MTSETLNLFFGNIELKPELLCKVQTGWWHDDMLNLFETILLKGEQSISMGDSDLF
jgi:hypothetical protein